MYMRMLETRQGSVDGVSVQCFMVGAMVDVPDGLAQEFAALGAAEFVAAPARVEKIDSPLPEQ